jgi:hypothetical protein
MGKSESRVTVVMGDIFVHKDTGRWYAAVEDEKEGCYGWSVKIVSAPVLEPVISKEGK